MDAADSVPIQPVHPCFVSPALIVACGCQLSRCVCDTKKTRDAKKAGKPADKHEDLKDTALVAKLRASCDFGAGLQARRGAGVRQHLRRRVAALGRNLASDVL